MSDFIFRETHIYEMPLPPGFIILRPELAVLKFGKTNTLDFGVLCYAQRTIRDFETGTRGRKIVLESLDPSRVESLRTFLAHIADSAILTNRRVRTLYDRLNRFQGFVNWADSNMMPDVLANQEVALAALRGYVEFIRDRVARQEFSLTAGASQQAGVVSVLSEFFDASMGRGLALLKRNRKSEEGTTPPSEDAQGKVLSLCESLFEGACELVLDRKPFPYALSTPQYLNFPEDRLWLFPTKSWFKTPLMVASDSTHAGYDYREGRLATGAELKIQYPSKTYHYSSVRSRAKRTLAGGNSDFNHPARKHIAGQAMNSFLVMFLAATGMNWTPTTELLWADDYKISPSTQGFRTVKWRANGKMVSFELPIAFMPKFKRYLLLREYCQKEARSDFLFFTNYNPKNVDGQIKSSLEPMYRMLRRLDPSLDLVLPRQWRAAKFDWLVRKTDVSTAAALLQTGEATALKHYTKGSESVHHEEMSAFLNQMSNSAMILDSKPHATSTAVGGCITYGQPIPISKSVTVKPDCSRSEGCLFCDKFKVHADETDTRKLFSCKMVLNMVAPLNGSHEAISDALGPIIVRLDAIIAEIAEHNPIMVSNIREDVEQSGALDSYWAHKAEMLMTLGI